VPGGPAAPAGDAAADRRVSRDRVAVVLHDAEEWSAVELAELLGISTDAAHKRIQRARARLIGALARERNSVATAPTAGCHDARAQAHDLLDGCMTDATTDATRARLQAHLDSFTRCPAALQAAAAVVRGLRVERGTAGVVPEPLQARLTALVRAADEAP